MLKLKTIVTTFALILLVASCLPPGASNTKDIFAADEGEGDGNERRHKARATEIVWTIAMSRCTGHLISPEYMMTANHCNVRVGEKFTSGYAQSQDKRNDIKIVQVTEKSSTMDYAILKISWANGYPKQQKFPPLLAISADDIKVSKEIGEGDELFTVGYPIDKRRTWNATYSEGRAKKSTKKLYYNIGTINGSSGGGVWRKSDKMLVSLTNGGSANYGQSGWNRNKSDSEYHWNRGIGMWEVYAVSKTLQDIFPNGKNRFSQESNAPELYAAIETPEGDHSKIRVSIPSSSNSAKFYKDCESVDLETCSDDVPLEFIKEVGNQKIYVTEFSMDLSDLTFVVASDSKSIVVDLKAK